VKAVPVSRIGLACALLAFLAGSAWASSKGPLLLQHPTSVAGMELPGGNYTIKWEGNGEQVEVKIYQGRKEVVSTSGRVLKLESPASYDSAVVTGNGDGIPALTEVRFGGKKFAIHLNSEGGSAGSAGAAR